MDTLSEIRAAVYIDLNANSQSNLYPTSTVDLAINRAYRKAGALYLWPETEDAKKTTTQANQEYYDFPDNWIPDSMWKLTVNGEDYGDCLDFKDYLYEKENDIPSGADYLWSMQWRRYFIYPTPTTEGVEISIWGQEVVDKLVNDSDTTIFSYAMPECNDAIVLEAGAILKAKAEDKETSLFKSNEAKQLLTISYSKIKAAKARQKRTQSFLNVPDFFGKNSGI